MMNTFVLWAIILLGETPLGVYEAPIVFNTEAACRAYLDLNKDTLGEDIATSLGTPVNIGFECFSKREAEKLLGTEVDQQYI